MLVPLALAIQPYSSIQTITIIEMELPITKVDQTYLRIKTSFESIESKIQT